MKTYFLMLFFLVGCGDGSDDSDITRIAEHVTAEQSESPEPDDRECLLNDVGDRKRPDQEPQKILQDCYL